MGIHLHLGFTFTSFQHRTRRPQGARRDLGVGRTHEYTEEKKHSCSFFFFFIPFFLGIILGLHLHIGPYKKTQLFG